MTSVDLRWKKNVAAQDVEAVGAAGAAEIVIEPRTALDAAACDLLARYSITVRYAVANPVPGAQGAFESGDAPEGGRTGRFFHSPKAQALKEEICAVGRKLWLRGFVDGNGGNISCRVGGDEVICTPTLFSKFDLTPDDLCLVDLEGNYLAGRERPTSEVRMHLVAYKNSPQAKAVVHCHPPHATAYAICGHVPPSALSSEFDVFIGRVALAQYETPGTMAFAETVRPYVEHHNAILLANHGVVCWADTPTHAEWYVENLESYCQTFLITRQLGVPCSSIPSAKVEELRVTRRRLGLPDSNGDSESAPVPVLS
ncbi:MAG: class II aldolase/adducin family protein [Acidobacteriota bacterium]|jgi:L-fuculose-phosphate aldolase|nr:class II aldolase/adducin family protein [Acidobacteriota bacterium]